MYGFLLIQRYGLIRGLIIYLYLKVLKSSKLSIPEIKHPIYLRAGSSDEYAFAQVFIEGEYDFEFETELINIIDAGANIGMASMYFKHRYPAAQIAAIEPHPSNVEAFQKHTEKIQGISTFQSALHAASGKKLNILDEGYGSNGFMTTDKSSTNSISAVNSISVSEVMKKMNWDNVDLMKIDIEGGEDALFSGNLEWMKVTKYIILEFHERMLPGSSTNALKALSDQGFTLSDVIGENILFTNANLTS